MVIKLEMSGMNNNEKDTGLWFNLEQTRTTNTIEFYFYTTNS